MQAIVQQDKRKHPPLPRSGSPACRSADALVDALKTPPHLGLGEVLVARIDSLEFGTVYGDAHHAQQIKLAAQRHEATADLTNGLAVVQSAMVLKSGANCPVSHTSSILRWHSRSR